jgi:hypothetical protein
MHLCPLIMHASDWGRAIMQNSKWETAVRIGTQGSGPLSAGHSNFMSASRSCFRCACLL